MFRAFAVTVRDTNSHRSLTFHTRKGEMFQAKQSHTHTLDSVCLARFHHLSFSLYSIIVLNIIIIIIGARHRRLCSPRLLFIPLIRFHSIAMAFSMPQMNNFLFNSANERHFSLHAFFLFRFSSPLVATAATSRGTWQKERNAHKEYHT